MVVHNLGYAGGGGSKNWMEKTKGFQKGGDKFQDGEMMIDLDRMWGKKGSKEEGIKMVALQVVTTDAAESFALSNGQ
ncbi:hypothetical protein LINPERPRIM_LOCUS3754 [Linum perenne]